jgi:undecaprenyl pyrophosphate synthase
MNAPELLAKIRLNGAIPRHVAIIMDGNGRWARERSLPRPLGHRSGMKAVREVVEGAIECGLEVLSLFAFSIADARPVSHGAPTSRRGSGAEMLATCAIGRVWP